jgi:hypothetical protein
MAALDEDVDAKGRGLPELAISLTNVSADVEHDEPGHLFEVVIRGTTSNGDSMRLGSGAVSLDEHGVPRGGPSFTLGATYHHNGKDYAVKIYDGIAARSGSDIPIGTGRRTALTPYAIKKFNARYKAKFGSEPDEIFGALSESNLLHFQREYAKLIAANVKPKVAAVEAVKRISFGAGRIEAGYTEFDVDPRAPEWKDFGKLGIQRVPTLVSVTARRP